MHSNDPFATSPTLLGRLTLDAGSEAWPEFVEKYAPAVYTWAWQSGLQESDAADVTQEVLIKLLEKIKTFQYDPGRGSFRGWLKTVTINAARDCGRRLAKMPIGSSGLSSVGDPRIWDDVGRRDEIEHRRQLLVQAESLVCRAVQPNTWRAYELVVKEGVAASEVAEILKMRLAEIYVAKSRALKRLRETIRELERIESGQKS